MRVFKACLRPVGVAVQALALAAFVPVQTVTAEDMPDISEPAAAAGELLPAGALPTSPTGRFTGHDAGDMESLLRDARLRSSAPADQTDGLQHAPDALPGAAVHGKPEPDTDNLTDREDAAPVHAPADTAASSLQTETVQDPEDAVPGSFFLGTIQRAGFFELMLHEDAVYALHSDGSELLLPASVQALPVLGSELSWVAISSAQELELDIPTGLYIFAADGAEAAFLKFAHADHCRAVYLSPDGTILAIDMGGGVNHHLTLLAWPSQQPLGVELLYYPGATIEQAHEREVARRAGKETAEAAAQEKKGKRQARKAQAREKLSLHSSPLLWHSGHGLVYRIMDTDTARPCGYEPCGVISVRSWYPSEDSASERALCAGTELCDCALDELKDIKGVPVAQVSMQCTKNIGQWRTREDKKTSFSLDVPVR